MRKIPTLFLRDPDMPSRVLPTVYEPCRWVVQGLGVAFVVLKLCNVIDWPWIWVLSPFWIGLCLFLIVLAIALIVLK